MYQKTLLENTDELMRAIKRARALGDNSPVITGKLILDDERAYLEDPSVEWRGTKNEVSAAALKQCGFDVRWTQKMEPAANGLEAHVKKPMQNDNPNDFMHSAENTDKEIWRKKEDDCYSPSIHVTEAGGVGIHVGGHVIVMSVEKWHALGRLRCALDDVFRAV